ncbi:hypothetical protein ACFWXI_14565 [[Kitasatospora] papulosa]|uniref:hypothetical protein n=1 Tax=[Kitasatospora] papulosa TaxID=1464011 RepID=UPI00369E6EB3
MPDQPTRLAPIMLRCETTVNGQTVTAQDTVSRHIWDECEEEYREYLRAHLRAKLGAFIMERLAPEVTVHEEGPVGEELWARLIDGHPTTED